jgi:hypothetical protein
MKPTQSVAIVAVLKSRLYDLEISSRGSFTLLLASPGKNLTSTPAVEEYYQQILILIISVLIL